MFLDCFVNLKECDDDDDDDDFLVWGEREYQMNNAALQVKIHHSLLPRGNK